MAVSAVFTLFSVLQTIPFFYVLFVFAVFTSHLVRVFLRNVRFVQNGRIKIPTKYTILEGITDGWAFRIGCKGKR